MTDLHKALDRLPSRISRVFSFPTSLDCWTLYNYPCWFSCLCLTLISDYLLYLCLVISNKGFIFYICVSAANTPPLS